MLREVIFDTETTGLEVAIHRMVSFAGVEMIDKVATGRTLHLYFNPEQKNDPDAYRVHGLSDAFLAKQKRFDEQCGYILDFLHGAVLVAHNAEFDMAFLQAELKKADLPPLTNLVVDTLQLAREHKRGGKHTLDVLCSHFGVNKSKRVKHDALIDSQLLAEVYVHLCGGRQLGLDLLDQNNVEAVFETPKARPPRVFPPPAAEELAAHETFIAAMPNAIWAQYTTKAPNLVDVEIRSLLV